MARLQVLRSDRPNASYHPNGSDGAAPLAFHQAYRAGKSGHQAKGVAIRPEAALPVIRAFERILYAQYRRSSVPSPRRRQAQSGLEDGLQEVLVAERAHEAIGMAEKELVGLAKQLRLEAEAKALPEKVRLVRDAVANVAGVGSGDGLMASSGYDPTPRRSGGWLIWDRFDVARDAKAVDAAFGTRGLVHHLTGRNLLDVLRTGARWRRRSVGGSCGSGRGKG